MINRVNILMSLSLVKINRYINKMDFAHSASEIKTLFDVLKDIVTDVNLVFKEDGVSIIALDPEKIVAVSVHMVNIASYQFSRGDPIYIGVNMQHLYKLVRGVNTCHSIRMEINPDTPNVLKVIIYHPTNGVLSTTSLYSLDIPKEQPQLPEIEFNAVCQLPTSDFMRSIKDLSHGTKRVTLSASQEEPRHLIMASKGSTYVYTTSISICPSTDGLEWAYFNIPKVQGSYVIKYIEKFAKPQLGKFLEIGFKSDGVINLSYSHLPIGAFNMTVAPIDDGSE